MWYQNLILKLSHPKYCVVTLIARDGVFQRRSYINVARMAFTPATRADYSVVCTPPATASYPYTITVRADPDDYGPLNGHTVNQTIVFTLVVTQPPLHFAKLSTPTGLGPKPQYLANLMDRPSRSTSKFNVSFLTVTGADGNDFDTVNGVQFSGFSTYVPTVTGVAGVTDCIILQSLPLPPPVHVAQTDTMLDIHWQPA